LTETLLCSVQERVALVTLNRPDRRNALNRQLSRKLRETLLALDVDEGVRAIVLTGAGPAFCAGVDRAEIAEDVERGDPPPEPRTCPVPALSTPLIAAVNGPAMTGGLELVLRCDFSVASTEAVFADTHAGIGLISSWGLMTLLPLAIGPRKARELSLTARPIDATTALAAGLVQHVVEHDRLLAFSHELATAIAENDPACVTQIRSLYDELSRLPIDEALARESEAGLAWARHALARPSAVRPLQRFAPRAGQPGRS
jgi:enoyl-CoA hydratase